MHHLEGELSVLAFSWCAEQDFIAREWDAAQHRFFSTVFIVKQTVVGEDKPSSLPQFQTRAIFFVEPSSDDHRTVGVSLCSLTSFPKCLHLSITFRFDREVGNGGHTGCLAYSVLVIHSIQSEPESLSVEAVSYSHEQRPVASEHTYATFPFG